MQQTSIVQTLNYLNEPNVHFNSDNDELLNLNKIVFEKLEEIIHKLVAQEHEHNLERNSSSVEIVPQISNETDTPALNASSIDSIIDLVIQQTHISEIRRMSAEMLKSANTTLEPLKEEPTIPTPIIVPQLHVTHHQHHHHYQQQQQQQQQQLHTNPTISTLLAANQPFVANENHLNNDKRNDNINNSDLVKVKQSKKALQGKYSVWKPKTAAAGQSNLISNKINSFNTGVDSNNGIQSCDSSTVNTITDKTNSLPVKVRKTHQSTLKNGEKKKEKKTIGSLNVASNVATHMISNNSGIGLAGTNTSNRKSKPPTLISSLLEQQDLLKKQQLQSKLSADSFEQIWEDHCYTPKMPWLKTSAPTPSLTSPLANTPLQTHQVNNNAINSLQSTQIQGLYIFRGFWQAILLIERDIPKGGNLKQNLISKQRPL